MRIARINHAAVGLILLLAAATNVGCAFGDRHVDPNYRPVMSLHARSSQSVDIHPFSSSREVKNEKQIGQVRNGYNMVTAKVYTNAADAATLVNQALAEELSHAGFTVRRDAPADNASASSVEGTLEEFLTDIGMGGYKTTIRVRLIVNKNGTIRLDKVFDVEDGGAGITASKSEYEEMAQSALTKLMRRAIPEVIPALDG